jgi:hypothetical protein
VLYYAPDALTERPVCFPLVFATRHEKGLFVMNDAMAKALDTFYHEVYSETFFPEFEREREQQVGTSAVQREISVHFSSKPFTIDDVKRHCMQNTEFLLKSADYRNLILEMAQTGSLRRLDGGQTSNARTRFRVITPSAAQDS